MMNRFALAYREQQQLFLLDRTYLSATLFRLGGLATLSAQGLVQFFYHPGLAVALTLGLFAVMGWLLWLAVRRDRRDWGRLPLCLVPALFWAASLADHALHFDALLAVVFAVGALCGYVLIRHSRLLWGVVLTLALYVSAGPAALIFAICALILDLFREGWKGLLSSVYLVAGVLCGCLAVAVAAVPTWAAALTPVFYYDFDASMPPCHWWTWVSAPVMVLVASSLGKLVDRPSKTGEWLVLGIGALLLGLSLIPAGVMRSRLESKEPLANYEYEHFVAAGDWDGLIAACKRNDWTPGTANYLNLALAHKGRLNDDLLKYDQRGMQSLAFLSQEKSMDVRIARIMDAMGNVAAMQDVSFNLLSSPVGFCPEMLKLNVRAELMRGSYKVADKYLTLLEKAPHYRQWARDHRRFLGDDAAVEADPDLGPGRRALPSEAGFALFESPLKELDRIIAANPDHPGAMQYALAFRLLAKDIEGLTRFVDRYFGAETLRTLPVPVQEALAFYSDYSRHFDGVEPVSLDWCLSHGVTPETLRRLEAFQQESIRSGGAAPKGSQGTYWYYLLYTQI